jgi:hypothetical protein
MLSGCWCLGLYPSLTAVCFSSFAVGNYTQAIECAKTYLLFFPNDEVMHQNLAYYTAMLGEEEASSISPREVRDWLLAEPNQKEDECSWGGVGWGRSWTQLVTQGGKEYQEFVEHGRAKSSRVRCTFFGLAHRFLCPD